MAEQEQRDHWQAAQSISLSVDLVLAAKDHRRFLARVSTHPSLLRAGFPLQHAIYRYKQYWLPFLARYGSNPDQVLVPPLDCAWIWHCHKLNPTQYINDCMSQYGKLLDALFVSSLDDINEAAKTTQALWDSFYPHEKYETDIEHPLSNINSMINEGQTMIYDLEAATLRQASFYYQVSEPHMGETSYLTGALQRYKGYLYLLKLSKLRVFLVPTYDIDLMWHSHQNCPAAYKQDMLELLGKVLNHDDTDTDRRRGQKLDMGFTRTRQLWQHTFGRVYERAGAMYRGDPPTRFPVSLPVVIINKDSSYETMQVLFTIIGARNICIKHKGTLAAQMFFQESYSLLKFRTPWVTCGSNLQWNSFWGFECETCTKGLHVELLFKNDCSCDASGITMLGILEITWEEVLNSSSLSWDGWMPITMQSKCCDNSKTAWLNISISVTTPVIAAYSSKSQNKFPAKNDKYFGSKYNNVCTTRADTSSVMFCSLPFSKCTLECHACGGYEALGPGCGEWSVGCGDGGTGTVAKKSCFRNQDGSVLGSTCGGCGSGGCGNGKECKDTNSGTVLGSSCGGCGGEGCGNGKERKDTNSGIVLGSSCGGCGGGGCGNGKEGKNINNGSASGSSCGGCGSGGCGNGEEGKNIINGTVLGSNCGGCGSGGCGNSNECKNINGSAWQNCNMVNNIGGSVLGSLCGGCGGGGCGSGDENNNGGIVLFGSSCVACGSDGLGWNVRNVNFVGSGCGGCGSGACGNDGLKVIDDKALVGTGCGGCGSGGGCGNGNRSRA